MNNNNKSIKHILAVECGSWKKTFFLDKNRYSIGRNSTNTFFCHHRVISRNHAHIIRINYESLVNGDEWENIFWLVDGDFLGNKSTNGVYVNGQKSTSQQLHPGDIIFFGGIDVKAKYDIVNLQSKTFFSIAYPDYKSIFSPDLNNLDSSGLTIFSTFTSENFDALELISQGVLIVDLETSQILKVNQIYCQMLGYSPGEIIGLKLSDLDASASSIIDYDLSILQKYHVRGDRTSIHRKKNKKYLNVITKSIPINYKDKKCILLSVENNQDIQKLEDILRYQRYHDLSTNLANKSLLEKQLAWSLGFNSLKESQIILIKIKINNWDNINNQTAVTSINQLLEKFILVVKKSLSSLDSFCRYSDDEYFILKQEIETKSQANDFIKKILEDFKKPITLNGKPIIFSVNCGIAIHPENSKYIEELIRNASLALEYSYEYGVNNYEFYHKDILQVISNNNQQKSLIYEMINEQNILIKYNPVIDVKTEKLLGLNSYICLEKEGEDNLEDIRILSTLKNLNYDGDLFLWMLEEIFKNYHSWIDKEKPSNINISLKILFSTLIKPEIIDRIGELVNSDNKFPQVELEIILDSNFIEQNSIFNQSDNRSTDNTNNINNILSLPINLALFNPDVNTIINLHRKNIKINSLKIPGNLINNLEDNSLEANFISYLVNIGKSLDIKIIAEGVNNENQKNILLNLGCDTMQGLFFSQPLLSEEVINFLSK